ncbi:MAG: hypothetical protein J6M07_04275, partial [Ruminococcus sp.]|nr:hypothetical protein [Ruminococcus sp.]
MSTKFPSREEKADNKNSCAFNLGTHIEALYAFIGGNLSEERFPLTEAVPSVSCADISPHCGESAPNPFPKTFNRILPLIGRSTKNVKTGSFTGSALSGAKLILKVL